MGDETLVALRFILGLDAGDILYFSSKINGGYDFQCRQIPKKVKWPQLNDYFASNEWREKVSFSDVLYKAVNVSLDLTIDRIGRSKFAEALKEHKYLISLAREVCVYKTVFPCSETGEEQHDRSKYHCYQNDMGCGYPCLDELYHNYTQ